MSGIETILALLLGNGRLLGLTLTEWGQIAVAVEQSIPQIQKIIAAFGPVFSQLVLDIQQGLPASAAASNAHDNAKVMTDPWNPAVPR